MQATQDIFLFLDLPRELRDLIYSFLLQSDTRKPPKYPWKAGRRRHEPGKKDEIRYEVKPTAVASYGLLCCNRQISAEMRKAISDEKAPGALVYKLDCMFEDLTLFPTWLSIPASFNHIEHLEVGVRLLNAKNHPEIAVVSELLASRLLKLLSQLLLHGPQFTHNRRLENSMPQLESLTINFNTMSRPDPRTHILALWLDGLAADGLLFGKVKTLWVRWDDIQRRRKIKSKGDISKELAEWAERGWVFGFKYNWKYEAEACCDGIGWQTS